MNATADRPRSKTLNPLRALLPFLRPYRGMMVAALGALLMATVAMLALPVALRQLIDHVVAAKDASTLNRYLIGFLAASLIFGVFAALRFYLVTWLGERVVADLRSAVYRRVVRMDPLFFETTRVGEVLSRLTTDTTLVQAISGVNLSIILRSSLSLIGGLIMLGLTSAKLMGVILVLIPVVVVPLIVIGRRVRGLSRASQDRIADTSGLAGETLNAIQTVQAFTLEELQSERNRKAVEDSFATAVRRTPVRAALTAIANFSLDVAAGETIAFVGPSGAGKSTTFQLLLRFYDPDSGRVLIDDRRLADLRPEDVRAQIGLVPQETVLFGASARENIRYGRPTATDAEIEAAAPPPAPAQFPRTFLRGYDTFP